MHFVFKVVNCLYDIYAPPLPKEMLNCISVSTKFHHNFCYIIYFSKFVACSCRVRSTVLLISPTVMLALSELSKITEPMLLSICDQYSQETVNRLDATAPVPKVRQYCLLLLPPIRTFTLSENKIFR